MTAQRPALPAFFPYAAVALAATAWGTWPLILRRAEALSPLHPTLESVIVMAVMTAASGVVMLRDRVHVRARAKDWLGIAWLGVGDAGNIVFFFAAYQTTSVAVAVLTHYLTPILVAALAPLALRERATARSWAAVVVGFVGLIVLLEPWSGGASRVGTGAALGAASAVCYASNVLVNKRLTGVFATSELMFFHGLLATPLLAVLVPHAAWAEVGSSGALVVAAGGVGPGAVAGLLFVWGLRHVPASHASTLTLLEPFVAVVLGALALHEALGGFALAGGALILFGAALVLTQSKAAAATGA